MAVTSSMAALTVLDSDCQVDLVLTDLVMPKGQPNGISLGRMARIKRRGVKVALMSGYDIDVYHNALPGKLFRKPVDLDRLVTEIGTLLSA
jgi:DNA-binding NtrC family response regulator